MSGAGKSERPVINKKDLEELSPRSFLLIMMEMELIVFLLLGKVHVQATEHCVRGAFVGADLFVMAGEAG